MKFHRAAKKYVIRIAMVCAAAAITLLMPMTTHAITGGYAASDVVGQLTNGIPDFTSSGSATSANTLRYPAGAVLDTVHHRLFVVDNSNNRVMVYLLDANNNLADHTADYVLGQPDFASNQTALTQSGLNSPYAGLAYDSGNDRLFVSDNNSNRVLVFNLSAGISDGMNASYVLGQTSFTVGTPGLSQSSLNTPTGLAYDSTHQTLYVADSNNKRILTYNVAPGSIANGMNAVNVIEQINFTSNSVATTQAGVSYPLSIAYNSVTQKLFVGDNNNNRVLVYNLAGGITNGMNASNVLGQADFTSNVQANGSPTASTVQSPEALAVDTQRNVLYVQDDSNNRVVAFDLSGGITNNMNARLVLGQTDFGGSDFSCPQASATNLCDSEGGLAIDPVNNRLYVTDSGYNRVMIYNFAHFTTPAGALTAATNGQAYSSAIATAGQQGTGMFSKVSGTLPPGLTLNTSTGVISGTPTQNGTYTFELGFEDNLGVSGSTYDDPSYSITVAAPIAATSGSTSTTPGAPDTGLYPTNSTDSLLAIVGGILLTIVSVTCMYSRAFKRNDTF